MVAAAPIPAPNSQPDLRCRHADFSLKLACGGRATTNQATRAKGIKYIMTRGEYYQRCHQPLAPIKHPMNSSAAEISPL